MDGSLGLLAQERDALKGVHGCLNHGLRVFLRMMRNVKPQGDCCCMLVLRSVANTFVHGHRMPIGCASMRGGQA